MRTRRGTGAIVVAVALLSASCGRERWEQPGSQARATPAATVQSLPTASASSTATPSAIPPTTPAATPATTPPRVIGGGSCFTRVTAVPTGTVDQPTSLTYGSDGAIWFTAGRVIGRLPSAYGGKLRRFTLPTNVRALSIAPGPDTALWFTDPGTTAIGRITTSGSIRMFPTPTRLGNPIGIGGAAHPFSITRGPDGAMWFTESSADRIGRIDMHGTITEYKLPSYSRVHANPEGIVRGPDDRLWFVQPLDETIAAFDPKTKTFKEYPLPVKDAFPSDITATADALWVADPDNGIARVTTKGDATYFALPHPDEQAWQVGLGNDGNALYLETKRGAIGEISEDGTTRDLATVGKGRLGAESHPAIASQHGPPSFVESQVRKIAAVQVECP